jgi:hypothetical protein
MGIKVIIREVRVTEFLVADDDPETALEVARERREGTDYSGAVHDDCQVDYIVEASGGSWVETSREIRHQGQLVGHLESRQGFSIG